jgi:hypothetical protein
MRTACAVVCPLRKRRERWDSLCANAALQRLEGGPGRTRNATASSKRSTLVTARVIKRAGHAGPPSSFCVRQGSDASKTYGF